jgi:hypothetical protein
LTARLPRRNEEPCACEAEGESEAEGAAKKRPAAYLEAQQFHLVTFAHG